MGLKYYEMEFSFLYSDGVHPFILLNWRAMFL
jgi:hypothetical protein